MRGVSGRVAVMLPYPFPGPFDYRPPEGVTVQPGDLVLVPLNTREEVGVVWDGPGTPMADDKPVPAHRLRSVIGLVNSPPMRTDIRRLIDWIAAYTLSPPGEVLRMALRVLRPETGPGMGWSRAAPPDGVRLTDARRRVLERLAAAEPRTTAELAREAEVSAAVIRGMADVGLVTASPLPASRPFLSPIPIIPGRFYHRIRAQPPRRCARRSGPENFP